MVSNTLLVDNKLVSSIVILWCDADLGTCRIKPMFMTDFQYEWIGIEDLKVIINDFSAFEEDE